MLAATVPIASVAITSHTTSSTPRPHVLYVVTVVRDDNTTTTVARRYSEVRARTIKDRIYAHNSSVCSLRRCTKNSEVHSPFPRAGRSRPR